MDNATVLPPERGPFNDRTQDHMQELAWLADLLDTRWRIPGTSWRFGLDAVAGLIPGAGDLLSGLAGLYIFSHAHRAGAPRHVLARMIGNLLLDTIVGSIPLLGRIFDVAFKANRRNLKLLQKHLQAGRDQFNTGQFQS